MTSPSIEAILVSLPARIWEASWQGAFIAAIVLAAQWMLRSRLSARWRNALWLLVFARLLIPTLPHARFSAYNLLPRKAPHAAVAAVAAVSQQEAIVPGTTVVLRAGKPVDETKPASLASTPPSHPAFRQSVASLRSIPWLAFLWLAGVLVTAAWSGISYGRLRTHVKRLRRDAPAILLEEFAAAKALLHAGRADLIISEAANTPFVAGFFRAAVILPAGLETQLSRNELRMVLLHELAHVKRGDLPMAWMSWLVAALHWFNPAVRFAMLRARKDREMACDEWVLRFIGDSKGYGSALIRFLEFSQNPPLMLGLGVIGIFENKSALVQRLRRIAAYRRPSALGAVAGIALLAVIGALTLTAASDESSKSAGTSAPALPIPPQEELFEAIADGDLVKVQKALKDGADPKLESRFEHVGGYMDRATPLYFAAEQGKLDIVRLLIANGADTGPGKDEWTNPIEAAMRNGFVDVAKYLHDHGAVCDPFVYAAATGDLNTVKKLAPAAKPDLIQKATGTAAGCGQTDVLAELAGKDADLAKLFQRAASTGSIVSAQYLLVHGVNLQDAGYDALVKAAGHSQSDMIAFLLKQGVNPNSAKQPPDSPLHEAARMGSVESVKLLLDAKADPNCPTNEEDDKGSTPLFTVCDSDNAEIARMLLDHGARLDIVNGDRFTPVLYAAYSHAPRCLALFIDRGADINVVNPGWKLGIRGFAGIFTGEDADRPDLGEPMSKEFLNRCMETVKVLLDKGVDINSTDTSEEATTFLGFAITNGQTACMEMLLKRGANINAVSNRGATLLITVILSPVKKEWRLAQIDRLFAHGIDPNVGIDNPVVKKLAIPSALKAAIISPFVTVEDRRKLVRLLLDKGARFDVKQGSDDEKMLLAATTGDLDGVKRLLAQGVSPNAADSKGWTPLLSASALQYDEILKTLLNAGADPKARDALGLGPLAYSLAGYPDLTNFRLLLDKGADINAMNSFVWSLSPIIVKAVSLKDPALLREMLKRGASANLPQGADEHVMQPIEIAVENLMEGGFKDEKLKEIIKILLAAGANPNSHGPLSRSLLYFPVTNNMVEMTQFLLAAGIDPRKDADGGKALADEAELHGSKEMKELIKAALEKKP